MMVSTSNPVYELRSCKSLEQIEKALTESAARHQFGVLAVHDLKRTMADKGVELPIECRIYEVCNPGQAKRVLEEIGALSTALPCRISVYGQAGAYTVATMLPTEMMKAFGSPAIQSVAQEVEQVLKVIMQDAAGQ